MEAGKSWLRRRQRIKEGVFIKNFYRSRLGFQGALLGIILSGLAFTLSAEEPGDHLETFLQKTHSLRAEFQQILLDERNQPLEESKGVFFLQRPGKFRWDYHEPFSQTIVADGEHVWFYDPDLAQVTVKNQGLALGDTPALLLSGKRLPAENFSISNLPSDNHLAWVELRPRDKEAAFERLLLAFDDDGLRQMELHDSFGRTTRLVFSKLEINLSLDPSLFVFTPPPGADVIGGDSP
ncbi:Outer membrane lipoprotein carrier protein LolA [Nitrosococcus oceani ATCC 19707]|uniref:Outer-membrane lipoprotein carrier protein n=2 Tax=Nitrosococcus oceani TaxID=1229 RepID=Q3JE72_NITOC|nr:Outer membrane lipoprotein carrier protein LolA [Nitrosococcus oceani ATCC 19707]EDZ65821.1 outer membrane lipoprotein carrier protein LolA [Nitrosococcus oceani AFC27]KFI20657.1 membrane protein [Nitrosococcus oceani C-27]